MGGLDDGHYRVVTPYFCAGFVVKGGYVTMCHPMIRKYIHYWMRRAERVSVSPQPSPKSTAQPKK
jgi:hypothetical protein